VKFESRNNCFWNCAGQGVDFLGKPLAAWQAAGHEPGSVIADPRFKNPRECDFTLAADSPALRLGFKPFDPGEAGVYGDAKWVRKASEVVYPPLKEAPPPTR